jgi:hypothetical protein
MKVAHVPDGSVRGGAPVSAFAACPQPRLVDVGGLTSTDCTELYRLLAGLAAMDMAEVAWTRTGGS